MALGLNGVLQRPGHVAHGWRCLSVLFRNSEKYERARSTVIPPSGISRPLFLYRHFSKPDDFFKSQLVDWEL